MDFVNRQWTYIRAQLEGLTATTKLLIGSLMVILLLVGFLGVLYAGQSAMQPLSPFIEGQPGEAVSRLNNFGIDTEMRGSQVFVAANELERAIAILAENALLSSDSFAAFEAMTPSPWMSNAQNARQDLRATMKMLSGVASAFGNVKTADVIIDVPETTGFGDSFRKPTATVAVHMRGNKAIPKHTQEALADLVAGSIEGLERSAVKIVDAGNGKSYFVADEDDMVPTDVIELIAAVEKQHQNKLLDVLGHIPGVRVGVNVSLDPTRQEHVESIQYEESQPLKSQFDNEHVSQNSTDAGNAGVRPNTEMSITTGAGDISSETTTESRTEFMDMLPKSKSVKQLAGHMAERVNVTINVPRSYFVGIFKANNPDTEEAPDDAALQTIIDGQLTDIREQVEPLVATRVGGQDVPGTVVAKMIYDAQFFATNPAASGDGGVQALLSTPWVGTASVAALALGAVTLMLMLVRKATQDEPLPTVEELAGVPDVLPADEELIGEAQDVESTMVGLEVSEDELKSRKIAEQISDLIKANPGEAGSLLGKWVDYDD